MEESREYKTNSGLSLERERFGSSKVKIQPLKALIKEEEETRSQKEEEEEGAKSIDVKEEKKHICSECGKRFKSGKALGGHKRIHMVETRKMVTSGVVVRYERGELEVACCVCHKKFTSMKALYGHMRFHPDRGWKGVMPPLLLPHLHGTSSSSTLSIDDDHYNDDSEYDDEKLELWENNWELENVVDLKESIKEGWSVKGKRGRRSVLKDSPSSEDIDSTKLLVLATTAEAVDQEMIKKKKKKLSEMEKESSSSSFTHQLDEEGGCCAREKHVCVTCNKSFTSYQALGGHRASHNKVKISENHPAARANNVEVEPTITGLVSAQGSNTSSNNGDHICNICHKSFTTGQALGGHKRCHWAGPAATLAPAAASSSQVIEVIIKPKKAFLEFDLNELPPNEEEERV